MQLKHKEHQLTKIEKNLKAFERDLQKRDQEVTKATLANEERMAELDERERLLNEVMRLHDLPLVKNGDLRSYLAGSENASTAFDSH